MNISANTLFHFTPKEEYFISILENGFFPRYCREDFSFLIPDSSAITEMAIPMVCFCDLRLSQTVDHSNKYGKYIIGLSKEWGINKGLTPLTYIHGSSPNQILLVETYLAFKRLALQYSELTQEEIAQDEEPKNKVCSLILDYLEPFMAAMDFLKPISGQMVKDYKTLDVYFYDEREWRYAPIMLFTESDIRTALSIKEYSDTLIKAKEEEKLQKEFKLLFTEDDIKYIVIPSNNDILLFQEKLKNDVTRLNPKKLLHKIRCYDDILADY